jgi:putative ABC transport system permease protein
LARVAWLAGAGILAGLALAAAAARALTGMLFQVTPGDAPTYAVVVILLGGVALLAAAVPAIRATRIDGSQVLRL